MGFPVRSATEATIGHLEIVIIAMNKETAAGQRFIWQSSRGTHPGSTATRKCFAAYAI
jgi:hypothetical protein